MFVLYVHSYQQIANPNGAEIVYSISANPQAAKVPIVNNLLKKNPIGVFGDEVTIETERGERPICLLGLE